jgi:CPA2 family monovalent cation:H+ antiporter-2
VHDVTLITTLAAAFGLAFLLGFIATRLRLPPLVGYLLAGVVIGPGTPGFVANVELSQELAEIGVILLMFGVGLQFSRDDLLSVRRIAVPGALIRILCITLLGVLAAHLWGWGIGAGIVYGIALSVASTVVMLRVLEGRGQLKAMNGRIAVGWLVVEDLATVLVLVLLPPLAGLLGGTAPVASSHGLLVTLLATLGRVALFIGVMFVIARRVLPWVLWQVAGAGSRELFTLAVVAVGVGIAYGAARLFGVSFALGAFLAGMVLRESELSHRAAAESLPLRDAFSVLFFVSVGMLLDPAILLHEPLKVLTTLVIVVVAKTLVAFGVVRAFRYPMRTALSVSVGLAQIGEFSFILASLGESLGLLPHEGTNLILAAAIISISVNPLLFHFIGPMERFAERWSGSHPRPVRDDRLAQLDVEVPSETVTNHVVLVGYGRVGRRIGEALRESGVPLVVIEQNREIVGRLRASHALAISGDAAAPAVLVQAHVARARDLVIAIPDAERARATLDVARRLNPLIHVVARTHTEQQGELLQKEHVNRVFMGEHELASSMTRYVLEHRPEQDSAEHRAPGPVA